MRAAVPPLNAPRVTDRGHGNAWGHAATRGGHEPPAQEMHDKMEGALCIATRSSRLFCTVGDGAGRRRRGGEGGASRSVVRLDGRELVHSVDEGCDVGVGVEHGGRDAVKAPALEHSEHGEQSAVSDGGSTAAEIACSCSNSGRIRRREQPHTKQRGGCTPFFCSIASKYPKKRGMSPPSAMRDALNLA